MVFWGLGHTRGLGTGDPGTGSQGRGGIGGSFLSSFNTPPPTCLSLRSAALAISPKASKRNEDFQQLRHLLALPSPGPAPPPSREAGLDATEPRQRQRLQSR
eukprot:365325-Chlamydomonas_euryale.AAC.2